MDLGPILEILLTGGSALVTLGNSFTLVKEGELGSLTSFGKAARGRDGKIKVIKPGFKLLVPFKDKIRRAHIRMDTVSLHNLTVTLKNGLSYHYSAFVSYHVSEKPEDLEKYLYQVEDAKALIESKLSSEVRELLAANVSTEEITLDKISADLQNKLTDYLIQKIGVILDACGLTSFTESSQAQLVNVSKAKMELAQAHYGKEQAIPDAVVAACLGAMPVVSGNEYLLPHLNGNEKKKKDTEKEKAN